MKRAIFVLATVVLAMGLSRPAAATTITFDEMGLAPGAGPDPWWSYHIKGDILTDQLASLGVLFSTDANGTAYVGFDDAMGNYLNVNTTPWDSGLETTLTVSFVDPLNGYAPTTASGISVLTKDGNTETEIRVVVSAFDAFGTLVETQNLTSYIQTLAFSSGNVSYLQFLDYGGDGHVIDNLSYTLDPPQISLLSLTEPLSVPEPGTLLLLTSGLALVGVGRHRFLR